MIERRTFLKQSTMAAAVLAAAPESAFGEAAPRTRQAFFEERKGTSLSLRAGAVRRRVEIQDVVPIHGSPELEQFHVVLKGDAIGEGLYTAVPERGAPMALHLRPADNGDVMATFCLLRR